ncbi:serine protease (plasmid) [Haloferax mediterranei ATCC 33500]|nr:serine protease [Haloferax mediterranei ATCC 33500]EMA05199.1 subtilisin-like serine protease [Haloferax mediterranei ATCC 33500]QCQ77360.1 serine protease [Haloferax mediterranei ATCC 33500]
MQNGKAVAGVSRRALLKTIGAGIAGTGFIGTGSAQETADNSRHIVGTKSRYGVDVAGQRADAVEKKIDFGERGDAVIGDFSDEALAELESRSDVRYVESDITVEVLGQSMPWGCVKVKADTTVQSGQTGKGAHVAVLDTGIDCEHPDLKPILGEGYAVVDSERDDEPWNDDHTHGTHCAGTVAAVNNDQGVVGVAPEVTLHAVKALNGDGSGSGSDIAEGIRWAADQGYDVISMSIGATSSSSVIEDAVQYAYDKGVLLVGAAGNEGPCNDCVHYPGAYDEVIAVSSTNPDDDLSEFSSTGPEVNIAAPGSDITSTIIGGGYRAFSGTSMATPHVSGVGAVLMANGASNTEARERLTSTASDIGLDSDEGGAGLLDAKAAVLGDSDGGDGGSNEFEIVTTNASDVSQTSATLGGNLTGLGDHSSATVGVEYWADDHGPESATAVEAGSQSSAGTYTAVVEELEEDTQYQFRAYAEAGSDTVTGTPVSFSTGDEDSANGPVVETHSPEDIEEDEAELYGEVVSLGDASEVRPGFICWKKGDRHDTEQAVEDMDTDEPEEFDEDVEDLEPGETYVAVATATTPDGHRVEGHPVTFTTRHED